jgi:hypothetical protein
MIPQRHGVDFFLRNKEENFVPAFMQGLGDRKSRKEMPPGSSAGDDELFGDRHED